MANSIGDMYRVAAAMGEDKRRNSPFTALANAVSMIANAWAQNKQMQAQNSEKQQQAYIDNLLKLTQMNESANRINFQNAVNNQAVADGYLFGYNANQPVFGNGARIGKDDNANGSLKDIISAAENIYNGLYTPQKKLGGILDNSQTKKLSAKVRLGNGGAVYDFSNAAEDNNDLKRAKLEAEIKAIEALAGQRKTVVNNSLPKSRQDKSYQNAIKLLNSYEKIAKDEMLNEDVLRAARLYAQEIRGQLADYLNTPDEEKSTFGWSLPAYRLEEVKEPGLFGTKTKLKFVPMGNSGKDKDPLGLF